MSAFPVITVDSVHNNYQQVAQQNWHQDQEDDPENEGNWWEGYLLLTLLLVVKFIVVQFSSGHGHHLQNGTSRVGEGITLQDGWN